ncbi:MAG: PduL/EutD family phosphate acyltransferase [Patescibacteria group bacterium]
MSRPIPVEVVPSHVHLSESHHRILFGDGHMGTVRHELSQTGQFAYEEMVEVIGEGKGQNGQGITLRVLGPHRKSTQVELTPTEARLLGIDAPLAKSGDLALARSCTLRTAHGTIETTASVIVPKCHLHLSDTEASSLRLMNGASVRVDVVGDATRVIENVVVRVHPTYRARLHIHSDVARDMWLHSGSHIRVRDIQS